MNQFKVDFEDKIAGLMIDLGAAEDRVIYLNEENDRLSKEFQHACESFGRWRKEVTEEHSIEIKELKEFQDGIALALESHGWSGFCSTEGIETILRSFQQKVDLIERLKAEIGRLDGPFNALASIARQPTAQEFIEAAEEGEIGDWQYAYDAIVRRAKTAFHGGGVSDSDPL